MWIFKKYFKVILVCLVLAVLIISAFMQLEVERMSQVREQQQFDNSIVISKSSFYKVIGDKKIEEVKDKKEGKEKKDKPKDSNEGTTGKYPGQTEAKENNGRPMADPFSLKCSAPPTYDCEYFDYAIPYDTTLEEIGGLANAVATDDRSGAYPKFSSQSAKVKAGFKTKFFEKPPRNAIHPWTTVGNNLGELAAPYVKHASKWMEFAKPPYGGPGAAKLKELDVYVHLVAIPNSIMMKGATNKLRDKKFAIPGMHSYQFPLVDIILKDGTVIHCAVYDTGADDHTAGGLQQYVGPFVPGRYKQKKRAWMWMNFDKMKLPQYRGCFFGTSPYQVFEWSYQNRKATGEDTKMIKKFDLRNNKPSFIRVYRGWVGEYRSSKRRMPKLAVPKWKGISSNGVW